MRHSTIAMDLGRAVALAMVYYVVGRLGLHLAFGNASATPVWPATGLALAATLVFGYRMVPAVFCGAFLVNLATAGSITTSLGIASGNSLECLLGAWLVNRFAGGRDCFNSVERIFKFTLLAALGSTVVSASCGVASLVGGGLASWHEASAIWVTWWLGDATGNLLVAPALLLWSAPASSSIRRGTALEAIALFASLAVLGLIVFAGILPLSSNNYPLDFICIPVLMWAVFRFGLRISATAIVVLAGVAIWGTLLGNGPFVRASPNESLLLLQAYMGVASVMTMMMAAAVAERQAAEDRFRPLSSSDPLTGLANFRHLMACVGAELKKVNDQHGHLAGNRALPSCTSAATVGTRGRHCGALWR